MNKRRRYSFWDTAELIPPILVRLLARKKHGRPLTEEEIALASGLSLDRIFFLSHQTTWEGIDVPTMRSYLRACQIDFCDRIQINRVKIYLKITCKTQFQPAWQHLRCSPQWKTLYEPMLKRYQRSLINLLK